MQNKVMTVPVNTVYVPSNHTLKFRMKFAPEFFGVFCYIGHDDYELGCDGMKFFCQHDCKRTYIETIIFKDDWTEINITENAIFINNEKISERVMVL